MPEPLAFRIENIAKQYPAQTDMALDGVSLALKKGELLALVGHSGSGKSTLVQISAGLLDADQGTVWLGDELVKGPAEQLVAGHERIRLLKQQLALSPNMRVSENLRYFLMKWPRPAQEKRVKELLALCRLEGLGDRFPRELSGGQQQRLALGRALADFPELLLLDEPFSHLDPDLKEVMLTALVDMMKAEGATGIWVTHDTQEAMAVADRICVMKAGKIVQLDVPEKVYRFPKSEYVAQLFSPSLLVYAEALSLYFPNVPKGRLCIRPWDWRLTANGQGIDCKVLRTHYMGHFWKIWVEVHGWPKPVLVHQLEKPTLHAGAVLMIDFDRVGSVEG